MNYQQVSMDNHFYAMLPFRRW